MKERKENLKISATYFPFYMYSFYTDIDSIIYHCKRWFDENINALTKLHNYHLY